MEQASSVVKNATIEDFFWRFPHIGEKFFKKLSYKNLVNCKTVSKSWYHYIIKQKFYQSRVHYENLQKNKDALRKTPLHKAAENGNILKCKSIIENVDNKNPADKYGYTPLHSAAMYGHLDICQLIIENVEDKNPVSNDGQTPRDLATKWGRIDVVQLFDS